MKKFFFRTILFVSTYLTLTGALYGAAEAFTYFANDELKNLLGVYWWLLFQGLPVAIALLVTAFPQLATIHNKEIHKKNKDKISTEQVVKIYYLSQPEKTFSQKQSINVRPPSPAIVHPYPLPKNWTSRDDVMDKLDVWLLEKEGERLFTILAIGGMGKSSSVQAWLDHRVLKSIQKYSLSGIFQWSFYEGEVSFFVFLNELCSYLNLKIVNSDPVTALIEQLQNDRLLLVLDGVERLLVKYSHFQHLGSDWDDNQEIMENERRCFEWAASRFFRSLASSGHSKILITSRLLPEEIENSANNFVYQLNSLSPEDAANMLRKANIRGSEQKLREAAAVYGNHPLSLSKLINVLHYDPDGPDNIERARYYEVTGDLKNQRNHVLSLAWQTLNQELKLFLGLIASLRTKPPLKTLKVVWKRISGIPLTEVLMRLENEQWILFDRINMKIDMHPIIRKYVYERLDESPKARVRDEIIRYYGKVAKTYDIGIIVNLLISIFPEKREEILNNIFITLLRFVSKIPRLALFGLIPGKGGLALRLAYQNKVIHTLEEFLPILEVFNQLVNAGNIDDARKVYQTFSFLVHDKFAAYYLELEMIRDICTDGEETPHNEVYGGAYTWLLNQFSKCYNYIGEPNKATVFAKRAIRINEKFFGNKSSLLVELNMLAMHLVDLGRLKDAHEVLTRVLKKDRKDIEAHLRIGQVLGLIGKYEESRKHFELVNQMPKMLLGRQGRSLLYKRYANYYTIVGEFEKALELAEISKTMDLEGTSIPLDKFPVFWGLMFNMLFSSKFFQKTTFKTILRKYPDNQKWRILGFEALTKDVIESFLIYGISKFSLALSTIQTNQKLVELRESENILCTALELSRKCDIVKYEAQILLNLVKVKVALKQYQNDLDDELTEELGLAKLALQLAKQCGYKLVQTDIHNLLARMHRQRLRQNKRKVSGKMLNSVMQNAEEALNLAKSDGPSFCYKAGYQEALEIISEAKSIMRDYEE